MEQHMPSVGIGADELACSPKLFSSDGQERLDSDSGDADALLPTANEQEGMKRGWG